MRTRLRTCIASLELPFRAPICRPCLGRYFATTGATQAGHNKWSKTKHIKAVTDKKKMSERTQFGKRIAMLSRLYGENVQFNPGLATAVFEARKASIPKAMIESSIARGQGRSATGAALEPLLVEIILPPNVAIVVEAETDNKRRTLEYLRVVVKDTGGLNSASNFYFAKRGRAVFNAKDSVALGLSDIMDEAIEIEGLEDVEELPDGDGFVVWTEISSLSSVTAAFANKFDLEILESDLVWDPNEDTMTQVDSSEIAETLDKMLSGLKEYSEVKGIYANVRQGSISDVEWERIDKHLDL